MYKGLQEVLSSNVFLKIQWISENNASPLSKYLSYNELRIIHLFQEDWKISN